MNIVSQIIYFIGSLLLALYPAPQFVEGMVGQPKSFLPSQARQQNERTISNLIFRGLFTYDVYGVLIPDLAETWSVSDDGLSYTIKLKEKQYWSNGDLITSNDLLYTAFSNPDLAEIATDKIDEYTVRYTLPNKYSPFLTLLTTGVMHQDAEKSSQLTPVTSSNFRVVGIERNGNLIKKVTLVDTKKTDGIKKLIFIYYPNQSELETAAKIGEIDGFVSESEVDLPNFTKHQYPLQGVYYALYFNLESEVLKDLALRKEMRAVLPIQQIINPVGIQVQGAISRSIYTDKSLNFDFYDKDLRANEKGTQIVITVPDNPQHTFIARQIKDFWEDSLKLEVTINKVPADQIVDKVIRPRNYQILLYGQEISRDPDRYVNWHSTQIYYPGLNLSNFNQLRVDRALEEGRKELDPEARVTHYKEVQKTINEEVPAIFLYHPYLKYYVSKYITGIGDKYTFAPEDRFLDFSLWKRVETF